MIDTKKIAPNVGITLKELLIENGIPTIRKVNPVNPSGPIHAAS
jgi:hypothetical protein